MKFQSLVVFLSVACNALVAEEPPSNPVLAYFSPDDQLADKIIELIDEEEKSIKLASYALTHRKIASALVDAKKRGVLVEVIVDPFSAQVSSVLKTLEEGGVPVFVWDGSRHAKKRMKSARMHHKFCVLGDSTLWTGSFNFTYSASRTNRENILLMKDAALAKQYLEHFEILKQEAGIPYKEYLIAHPQEKVKWGKKPKGG